MPSLQVQHKQRWRAQPEEETRRGPIGALPPSGIGDENARDLESLHVSYVEEKHPLLEGYKTKKGKALDAFYVKYKKPQSRIKTFNLMRTSGYGTFAPTIQKYVNGIEEHLIDVLMERYLTTKAEERDVTRTLLTLYVCTLLKSLSTHLTQCDLRLDQLKQILDMVGRTQWYTTGSLSALKKDGFLIKTVNTRVYCDYPKSGSLSTSKIKNCNLDLRRLRKKKKALLGIEKRKKGLVKKPYYMKGRKTLIAGRAEADYKKREARMQGKTKLFNFDLETNGRRFLPLEEMVKLEGSEEEKEQLNRYKEEMEKAKAK